MGRALKGHVAGLGAVHVELLLPRTSRLQAALGARGDDDDLADDVVSVGSMVVEVDGDLGLRGIEVSDDDSLLQVLLTVRPLLGVLCPDLDDLAGKTGEWLTLRVVDGFRYSFQFHGAKSVADVAIGVNFYGIYFRGV